MKMKADRTRTGIVTGARSAVGAELVRHSGLAAPQASCVPSLEKPIDRESTRSDLGPHNERPGGVTASPLRRRSTWPSIGAELGERAVLARGEGPRTGGRRAGIDPRIRSAGAARSMRPAARGKTDAATIHSRNTSEIQSPEEGPQ
jgi:hypothetical protein